MGFIDKVGKAVAKFKEAQEKIEENRLRSKKKEIENLKKKIVKKKAIKELDDELELLKKELED